jgi:methionine salvage enolase-phosphatase E1
MDPGLDNLQQKVDASGKGLVDNEKANEQRVSITTSRPLRGQNWTSILRKANLEAPGYQETVEKIKREKDAK